MGVSAATSTSKPTAPYQRRRNYLRPGSGRGSTQHPERWRPRLGRAAPRDGHKTSTTTATLRPIGVIAYKPAAPAVATAAAAVSAAEAVAVTAVQQVRPALG